MGNSVAQQWNEAQKEVWGNVEKYWSLDDSKDLDGFLNILMIVIKGGRMILKNR